MKVVLLLTLEFIVGTFLLQAQSKPLSTLSQQESEQVAAPLMMMGGDAELALSDSDNNRVPENHGDFSRHSETEMSSLLPGRLILPVEAGLEPVPEPAEETKKITLSDIYDRGYLKIDSEEFQIIAPPTQYLKISSEYSTLINELKKYTALSGTENITAKEKHLQHLEETVKKYLAAKMKRLTQELEKPDFDNAKAQRVGNRIAACNLLFKGIEVERFKLKNCEVAHCSPKGKLTPRYGSRFKVNAITSYQPNYAAGACSSVKRLTHEGIDWIFKDENPTELLPRFIAKQLDFLKDDSQNDLIRKGAANLSGRAVGTYKISEVLGADIVPFTKFAAISGDQTEEFGHVQAYVSGVQLYEEEEKNISQEELEQALQGKEEAQEYLAEVALGGHCQPGWQLCFPNSLARISDEKPLLKNERSITPEEALKMAQNGELYFKRKELAAVNQEINFRDPLLQKSMSNIQWLHLLTGQLDPNPLNVIYVPRSYGQWLVYAIDGDLSFSRYFKEVNNDALEEIRQKRHAAYIRNIPLFIDEKMGEAILALTPEKIEETLLGTGLTPKEVSATQSRLFDIQQHVQLLKNGNGYVRDEDEETLSIKTMVTDLENKGLVWGAETYALAEQHPESSFLGWTLKAKEDQKSALKELLQNKIAFLAAAAGDPHNELELSKTRSRLKDLNNVEASFDESGMDSRKAYYASHARLVSVGSEGTAFSSNTAIGSILRGVGNIASQARDFLVHEQLRLRELTPTGFIGSLIASVRDAISNFIPHPTFDALKDRQSRIESNSYLYDSKIKSRDAQETSKIASEQALQSDVDFLHLEKSWRSAASKWEGVVEVSEKAIHAFEQELEEQNSVYKFFSTREAQLHELKNEKEHAVVNALWTHLHHLETQVVMIGVEINDVDLNSQKSFIRGLLKAQQGWRNLIDHLSQSSCLKNSTKDLIEENFKQMSSIKIYHDRLRTLLEAVRERYNSANATFSENFLEANQKEINHWTSLLSQMKEGTASFEGECALKWGAFLKEIELQEKHALFQKELSQVIQLQHEVNSVAQHFIEPHIYSVNEAYEDFSITVDEKKLEHLCSRWQALKSKTALKNETANALDQIAVELSPDVSRNEKKQKPSEAASINVFGLFGSEKDKMAMISEGWKPTFPSISLEVWKEEMKEQEGDQKPYVSITTKVQKTPAKRFLETIDQYPNFIKHAPLLREMLESGVPTEKLRYLPPRTTNSALHLVSVMDVEDSESTMGDEN